MAGRIVVGVDGSDSSIGALRWAFEEAARRGSDLDVVHAWSHPFLGEMGVMVPNPVDATVMADHARAVIDRCITSAGPPPAGVHCEPIVVEGDDAAMLLEAAVGADLLVVGSRGRGGFASLLLGSVSQQCALHASCPVVIVPQTAT